jgi:hypothetical protein
MLSYSTEETFSTWELLDTYFRQMPAGTRVRVDRREDSPGQTLVTYGVYEKDRTKSGRFDLISGKPMFFHGGEFLGATIGGEDPSQAVYPDELIMSDDRDNLRFRILSLG